MIGLRTRISGRIFPVLGLWLICVLSVISASSSPSSNQYHIQTDEGPERYFRYQTDNGQFRKEKRLADGTVTGTDAWIDGLGYLRMKDYIADNEGYRIVRSKTVFVGQHTPIQEAMKIAKKQPAQSGTAVNDYLPPATTILTTTQRPITPSSIAPPPVRAHPNSIPVAYIPAKVSDTYLPATKNQIFLGSTLAPPFTDEELQSTPIAVYNPTSTTPRPEPNLDYGPPIAIYPNADRPIAADHDGPFVAVTPKPHLSLSNWLEPPRHNSWDDNAIDQRPYVRTSSPKPFAVAASPVAAAAAVPLFNRDTLSDPRFAPLYDGVSVTKNGFRYYLPRHYQEEESYGNNEKAGSFGYIDPFGIRRVIYYNAGGPGKGFVVRKNNRYVGFNATPYDPRPPL